MDEDAYTVVKGNEEGDKTNNKTHSKPEATNNRMGYPFLRNNNKIYSYEEAEADVVGESLQTTEFGEPQETAHGERDMDEGMLRSRRTKSSRTTNCSPNGRTMTATSLWPNNKVLTTMESVMTLTTILLFASQQLGMIQALDTSSCLNPLGMESEDIPDEDLSASSSFEIGNVGPQNGRVRVERQGGAWCPKNQITSEAEEWLQIDLHTVHVITGTETQGRFGNGQGQEFAEAYVLSYWRPELNKWVRYRDHTGNEILKGNINTYLASKTELNPPIIGSKLRILPYSYHRRTACMRAEIYGCPLKGGLLSYTMPQGHKRGDSWNFYDHTYDGFWDGNYLRNGLGQLTDGRGGPGNFKDDFYGHERGRGWVGWKNDTSKNGPVEIVFKFDSPQEFIAVHLHTSNQFTKDVQVFSEARVMFGMNGKQYSGEPIVFRPMEGRVFEEPRNITINLLHRIAQYVKIQLFWSAKWILISEVTFESQPATIVQNTSERSIIQPVQSGLPKSPSSSSAQSIEDVILAQSEASEPLPGNRLLDETTPSLIGSEPSSMQTHRWNTTTILVTAVVSSIIAVVLVLLIIVLAFVVRHKLQLTGGHRKSPSDSQEGTLPYDNQADFGYASPEEIRKCKITTGEYTEPFSTCPPPPNGTVPPLITFPGSNLHSASQGIGDKMAEYYSCTLISNPVPPTNSDSCSNEYEYAVPNELGKLLPNQLSPMKSIPNSPAAVNRLRLMQVKFREVGVPEISKRELRMLRKLGDGAFGTVFVGELNTNGMGDKSLVAVKHLLRNATEKDKSDFLEEVRLLASLNDPNVAQVLGICVEEEPFSVVLEFLELGDLCQFLRQNDTLLPNSNKKIGFGSLLFIASQIASGMRFLESRNIVHRDLATRNCVVGRGLVVKISHFATDTDLYASDYYRLDGKMPLPVRWMAWESIFLGKYSTKSDVWSFGVTLWEILSYCRHSPYPTMSNQEVLHNLRRLSVLDDMDPFETLAKPHNCPRDIYQLMCDTWRRADDDRPTFWEIHSFISRKKINFSPHTTSSSSASTSSNNNKTVVTLGGHGKGHDQKLQHYMV